MPLYVQASTILPGDTSHGVTAAVSSNCLTPSGITSVVEQLVADPLGLGRKGEHRVDHHLVHHRRHLLVGHLAVVHAGHVRRPGGGAVGTSGVRRLLRASSRRPTVGHDEIGGHPGAFVAGYFTEQPRTCRRRARRDRASPTRRPGSSACSSPRSRTARLCSTEPSFVTANVTWPARCGQLTLDRELGRATRRSSSTQKPTHRCRRRR